MSEPDGSTRLVVKICGLREPAHAVWAAEQGADLLGFVFAPSRRQVTAQTARRCIEAARAADHLSGTVTGVNVNGRLSYVFEDQDPQGRPGFVLISPLGEGYLTVSTRSSTKDKAWDQLVAVVSSLS